ncbi:conserved hypothetical protein [Vibrio chagasii]|nr:conserved hypothetical protein [Vibrio chagasii]
MKILYFDTFSLFYSQQYITSDKNISLAYERWRNSSSVNLLKAVKPDLYGISKLRRAAIESGFKLYPLGTRYNRALFIGNNLLSDADLAPDTTLTVRLGDNDPIRRMIAHSHKLKATWYFCGDVAPEAASTCSARHLKSTFGLGVTDELITKIRALKTV